MSPTHTEARSGAVTRFPHALKRPGAPPLLLRAGAPFTLGRDPTCSLVITSPTVSREHAVIEWSGTRPVLVDRSSYGTLVNGRPIDRHPLSAGDEVQIGPFVCVYESGPSASGARVDAAIDATVAGESGSFAGVIGEAGLAEHLQSIEFNGRTGTLSVFGVVKGEHAWLAVKGGVPLAAESGGLLDERAVLELLTLRKGRFAFLPEVLVAQRRMRLTITGCLLEASRRADEGGSS